MTHVPQGPTGPSPAPTTCPRKGELRVLAVDGVPGALVTVVHAGPRQGGHFSDMARALLERKPPDDAPNEAVEAWYAEYVDCLVATAEALCTSIDGVAGFEPQNPKDAGAFVEFLMYLTPEAGGALMVAVVGWQCPNLAFFARKGK